MSGAERMKTGSERSQFKKNHRDETGQFDKRAIAPKLQKNNLRPAQCSRGRVSALTLGGCGFIVVPCCLPDCHSVFGVGLGRFDHPLVPWVKFWMGQITFNTATETGKTYNDTSLTWTLSRLLVQLQVL